MEQVLFDEDLKKVNDAKLAIEMLTHAKKHGYEDAINYAIECIGLRQPKKPDIILRVCCPHCHVGISANEMIPFCYECGQALDWKQIDIKGLSDRSKCEGGVR